MGQVLSLGYRPPRVTPLKELEHALEGNPFRRRHIMLLLEYVLFPSTIPGDNLFSKMFAISLIPPMVASMMVLGFMVKIGCRLPVSEIAKTLNTVHPSVIDGKSIVVMAMGVEVKECF